MFKFKLGDKVFIKSLKKEGKIVGCFWEQTQTGGINVSYSLAYETDWGYNGKKLVHVRAVEDGLDSMDKYERVAIGPKGLLKITNDEITKEDIDNVRAVWDSVVVKKDGFVIPTGKYPSKIATWKGWVDAVDDNISSIIEGNTPDEGHCDDYLDALHYMAAGSQISSFDSITKMDFSHLRRQEISSAEAYREWSNPPPMVCHDVPDDVANVVVNGIKVDILSTDSSETISMKINASVEATLKVAPVVIDIPSCDHQWLPYEGLTQRFEYCKHCDVKK